MINVLEHRAMIEGIFDKYGLPKSCYEIVPDVQKWCEENGIKETSPFRAAKCLCRTKYGKFHIVFREEQTDKMIASAKAAMEWHGFKSEVSELDTDLKYLEHLILHEVACKTLDETAQNPRDEWSFREMGI